MSAKAMKTAIALTMEDDAQRLRNLAALSVDGFVSTKLSDKLISIANDLNAEAKSLRESEANVIVRLGQPLRMRKSA